MPPVPVYHVHDLSYRGLLSVKAVFLDFLRSFVPADWVRDLDEDSFTQVESTLVLQDLRKREPDVVWRGRLRTDGREIVVVVLVEVQSTVETRMALRLLGYMTAAEGSAKQGGGGRSGDEFRADAGPVAGEDEAGGRVEGQVEERKATAVRLMAKGMDDGFIAEVTGLSPEEIARLRREKPFA